jgi:trimethylamine--corrinoid protein Co-methyltransferase
MAGLFSALAGSEMVVGVGGMSAASVLYPENLVLDCDLLHDIWVTTSGIEVNAETLALDMVKRVGPRGHYLMEDHTLKHLRQIPFSDLILETSKRGRTGATAEIETAREEVRRILDSHRPDPLENAKMAELDRILAAADRSWSDASHPGGGRLGPVPSRQ